MADDLGSIYVSIRADTSQLKADLARARGEAREMELEVPVTLETARALPQTSTQRAWAAYRARQAERMRAGGGMAGGLAMMEERAGQATSQLARMRQPAMPAIDTRAAGIAEVQASLAKATPIRATMTQLRADLDQAEQMIGTSASKMTRAGYVRMSAKLDKLESDLQQGDMLVRNKTEYEKHLVKIGADVDAFHKDLDGMTVGLGKRLWKWNKMVWLFKRLIVAGGIGWVVKSVIGGVFSAMDIAAKAMSNVAGGSTTLATNLAQMQTRIMGVKAAFGLAVADALGLLDTGSKLGDSANTWGAAWGEAGNKLAATFRAIKALVIGIFVGLRGLAAMMISLPRMAIAAALTEPLQKMGAWLLKLSSDRKKAGKGGALTDWARDYGNALSGLGNSLQQVSGTSEEAKADFVGGARDVRDAWNETGEEIGAALDAVERGPPPLTRNAEELGRAAGTTTKTGMILSTGMPATRQALPGPRASPPIGTAPNAAAPPIGTAPNAMAPFTGAGSLPVGMRPNAPQAIPSLGPAPNAPAPFTRAGSLGFGKQTGDDATTIVGLLNRIATATERSGGYYK